jgi:hypothetical protein
VGWDGRRLHAPQVPLPAPSVMLGVAVENLSPEATARNTHEVVPADNGGEVADHEHDFGSRRALADEAKDGAPLCARRG